MTSATVDVRPLKVGADELNRIPMGVGGVSGSGAGKIRIGLPTSLSTRRGEAH